MNRKVILTLVYPNLSKRGKVSKIWEKFEQEINTTLSCNGKPYTLQRYKESYLFLRNFILELETQPIPFCISDSNGIPKTLWTLRPLLKGDRNDKRIALCIARNYEKIKLPISYCTETITKPLGETLEFNETSRYFKVFLTEFSKKYPWYIGSIQQDDGEIDVMKTLAKGPNGPAVASAHLDIAAIKEDSKLKDAIFTINKCLKRHWVNTMFDNNDINLDNSKYNYIHSKLGFSAEPGGKTRIFAIADWWTQTTLKPLQVTLNNVLKKISTDSTHNQNKGFESLLVESKGSETYCFDLTAASDRIPAAMQEHRIKLLGGNTLSRAWYTLMTERDFHIRSHKTKVRWKVGQPLGLLSSFPSFALWHHDIIQYVYNYSRVLEGKPLKFFNKYRLLGDDVVIWDKKVALAYHKLITQTLQMEVNMTKSVIGNDGKSQIEFTKRLALSGVEMSSIRHNILSKSDELSLIDLVDILYERKYLDSSDDTYYDFVDSLGSEMSQLINFFLWIRSSSQRAFKGANGDLNIEKETALELIAEARSSKIKDKSDQIDRFIEDKPLDKLYDKVSVPYSRKALGKDAQGNLELHPLVWAINLTNVELSAALSNIWYEREDVAPIEFLPLVSAKAFFFSERSRGEYLSQIVIDVYAALTQENEDR